MKERTKQENQKSSASKVSKSPKASEKVSEVSKNIKSARSKNKKTEGQPKQPIIKWGHETEITDVSWLWKPLIPYGKVTLIEGAGGDGKTTLILTIAAMVSSGKKPPTLQDGELLPSESTEPQTVFYLTNEDEISDSSLKKFSRAGGDMTRFAYSGELQYHVTMDESELAKIIEETGAKLFIIDPFQAFLPPKVNMNDVNQTRPLFTMLSNVAKNTSCAIVLIGHLNKNEGGRDIYRGMGSADISSSVRSLLMVKADKKRGHILETIKCNFDEADYTKMKLTLDSEKRLSLSVLREIENETSFPAPYITKAEEVSSILREMLAVKPVPISEVVKVLLERGISYRTAQRAREEIGARMVSINGVRCWKLPSGQVDKENVHINEQDMQDTQRTQGTQGTQDTNIAMEIGMDTGTNADDLNLDSDIDNIDNIDDYIIKYIESSEAEGQAQGSEADSEK